MIIPSASSVKAMTSPLIAPSTMEVISSMTSLNVLPEEAMIDGLVVMPEITPMA